jgi:hypothetical protein
MPALPLPAAAGAPAAVVPPSAGELDPAADMPPLPPAALGGALFPPLAAAEPALLRAPAWPLAAALMPARGGVVLA